MLESSLEESIYRLASNGDFFAPWKRMQWHTPMQKGIRNLQVNTRVGDRYEGRCNSFAKMHFCAERAVGGKRICDDLEKTSERVGRLHLGVWVRNLNGFLLNT